MDSKTAHMIIVSTIAAILYMLLVPIIMIWAISAVDADTCSTGQAIGIINPPEILEPVIAVPEIDMVSLGEFKIYHYCACEKCCSKTDGITATGTIATAGRTIATDPEVIPLGSTVIIDGQEYVAEDTGGAIKGNRLDVFVSGHDKALQMGVREVEVFKKGGQ